VTTLVGWSRVVPGPERLLSATELTRMRSFRYDADRARFRSSHVLARRVVAQLTGSAPDQVVIQQICTTCGGPHGRPETAPGGPHVSWSSADDRVVAAATYDGPVGVDVESVAAVARAEAGELSPAERERGPWTPQRRAVTWVRKESLLKATGDGLAVPLAELVVSAPDQPARLESWPRGPGARLADLDLGAGYAGCLAVLGTGELRVEVRELSA
jgi:4'-phosphopantetheinyl transferase